MKRSNLILSGILVSLLTFFNSLLFAQDIQFAVDESNPPFMYKDSTSGQAAGLYPEMVKIIFNKIGTKVTVTPYQWKRLLSLSESGDVGVAGIYKNEKRLLIYDYSEPIFDEKIVIYTKKENKFNFSGVSDLKGKKIGVIRGWSYGDDFDKLKENGEVVVDETTADEFNFKKLEAGRLDCLLTIQQAGDALVQELGLSEKVVMLGTPVVVNPTYIVFAKSTKNQELIQKINAALDQVKQDGSYQAMMGKIF